MPRPTAVSSGSRDRHLGLGAMNRGIVDVRQRRQESFASEGWSLARVPGLGAVNPEVIPIRHPESGVLESSPHTELLDTSQTLLS